MNQYFSVILLLSHKSCVYHLRRPPFSAHGAASDFSTYGSLFTRDKEDFRLVHTKLLEKDIQARRICRTDEPRLAFCSERSFSKSFFFFFLWFVRDRWVTN